MLALKTSSPAYSSTGAVNWPLAPTGTTGTIPYWSVSSLSSSPKAGAMCTMPVPSVVVT